MGILMAAVLDDDVESFSLAERHGVPKHLGPLVTAVQLKVFRFFALRINVDPMHDGSLAEIPMPQFGAAPVLDADLQNFRHLANKPRKPLFVQWKIMLEFVTPPIKP